MSNDFTRRNFLATTTAFAASGTAVLAAPPKASLRPQLRAAEFYRRSVPDVDAIVRAQKLSGKVAYAVADASTGQWLECENEQDGTPPASVTKAVTALYALDALGPDHRFETRLMATGGIADGEIQGDLILVGGGDPTLDTDDLATLAANLKKAGIIGVKGGFKVYDGALPALREIDPAQPDHVGYNPALSGLALNYNRVHFEWKRANGGFSVAMDARTEKYRPAVAVAAMAIRDRNAPIYTYEDRNGQDRWTVARGALGNGGSRWLPVRRPALYAGDVFATLAGSQGIRLGKAEVIATLPKGGIIATHTSDDLRTILRAMLKYSTNLIAEMVGLAATKARIGSVETLAGSAAEMNDWAHIALGMKTPQLVDHSGLGDASRLTALDMARALVAVHGSGLRPILKGFALRDEKGRPLKDHPVRVDAKTGTLNFVSSLAGYVTAQDGTVMAFAIFAANADARAKISRAERERPAGARTWNRRAKRVQQALIERWDALYGRAET